VAEHSARLYTDRKWSLAMFRFTVRELLLLTLVVALVTGWILDHRSMLHYAAKADQLRDAALRRHAELKAKLERRGVERKNWP
jgi:hypothetical protein